MAEKQPPEGPAHPDELLRDEPPDSERPAESPEEVKQELEDDDRFQASDN
jgi:hypothetical protein